MVLLFSSNLSLLSYNYDDSFTRISVLRNFNNKIYNFWCQKLTNFGFNGS